MAQPILQTENLTFRYTTGEGVAPTVLDNLTLSVRPGEFVAVLGHNGSGKSTLAKHFNAILLPSGGKVYVDGLDTCGEEHLLDIRRRVGMVFQNPDNQIVANVVEEDVAFGPENLGVPSAEIRERVDAALEPYPDRWTHHIVIGSAEEIDGELLGWIREASEFSAQKR